LVRGYVETVIKERVFYFNQVKAVKIIGVRTMQDFFSVLLLLTIPILVGVIMFTNIRNLIPAVSVAYATSVFYYLLLFNFSIPERKFTGKMSWFILFTHLTQEMLKFRDKKL